MARKAGKGKAAGKKRKAPLDVYEHGDEDDLKEQRENDRMDVDGVYEYEAPEKISRDQDSEIDEDEAFNSDDEATFGNFFSGKKEAHVGKTTAHESDDNTVDDDEDDDGGDGDLLSDMLGTAPAPRLDTVDDSADDDDDDDDDDEDDEKHASLLNMVHSLAKGPKRKVTHAEATEDVAPSAFSKKLSGSALTLEGLLGASMAGLPGDDDEGDANDEGAQRSGTFVSLKKQLASLEKDDSRLQAPVAPVVEARASRKVAYADKKKQMDVFQPVIKANREKETLDFRTQGNQRVENITVASLTSKFVPEKPMENDVAALLEASGWSDKSILKEEAAELAANEISVDEVRARQGELAKMRAMMFYQEQKNKRIKKIKSKLYHKIRNKQEDRKERMALRELDPEFAAQMDAEDAEKRAEERMTLKHTNTSKWVKHQLARGINADQGTRSAIADQLRRGDDLRKKMQSVNPDSDDDESDDDDDHASLDGMTETEKLQHRLQKKAATLVMDIEADSQSTEKAKGLQGMKFMQKAVEKQRERALEEAEALLKELRGDGGADNTDDETAVVAKPPPKKKVKATPADHKSVEKDMVQGTQQMKSVMMDKSHKTRVSSAIKVNFDDDESTPVGVVEAAIDNDDESVVASAVPEENPWLSGSKVGKKRRKRHGKSKTEAATSVATAMASLAAESSSATEASPMLPLNALNKKRKEASGDSPAAPETSSEDTPSNKKAKTAAKPPSAQEELVRKAFAFAEDTENEIQKEKDLLAARDADVKVGAEVARLTGMEGWGSWAGQGIKPSKRQNARLALAQRKVVEATEAALAKRKDSKMETVLINEKKDKKAAKFMVSTVPYPFTSREQYELAMRNPLGSDWNTARASNALTVPEVMTRAGKMIEPLRLTNEQKAPAKVQSKTARQGKLRKAKF
ncbi:hypothetical protein DYB32_008913 [Aphanomyces invadans]|uniref:U3 small nucleolar RNA-associated protein 14 n=1 Tax=Aphanomyces invadans TaxID=157072 RepID=A0A3R6WII0_9STRA|nr:hypothetical protein DYB32_008913 [Aphanomyces invadans]